MTEKLKNLVHQMVEDQIFSDTQIRAEILDLSPYTDMREITAEIETYRLKERRKGRGLYRITEEFKKVV